MHTTQFPALYHAIFPYVTVLRPDYYTQPSHHLKRLVQLYSGGQNIRRWFACFWLSDTVSNHFRSMSSILHRSFSIHFRPCRNPAHSLFSSPRLPIPEPCAILGPILLSLSSHDSADICDVEGVLYGHQTGNPASAAQGAGTGTGKRRIAGTTGGV